MTEHVLVNDLNYILQHTESVWDEMRGQKIFITGGTGFFGCWLLESFLYANQVLNLQARAYVLTRNAAQFLKKCPQFSANSALVFVEGDVRTFAFPPGEFSHVIHAATDANAFQSDHPPVDTFDTIVAGTKHVLEFAVRAKAKKFLLTSSGAVYGVQPPTLSHVAEDYPPQPNLHEAKSVYAVGKCLSEHLSCLYAKQYGIEVKIIRGFAFVGPYLPIDAHFAIGNFIRDHLQQKTIVVNGDGTPLRSYLYAADLAIWLWVILTKGESCRVYNVGSDVALSIAELAELIAGLSPVVAVKIKDAAIPEKLPSRYVPNVDRAMRDFNLPQPISLQDAILRTIAWHKSSSLQCGSLDGSAAHIQENGSIDTSLPDVRCAPIQATRNI